jgi:hypothetical protein
MVLERYLEDALPLIVAGLEALLKVGRTHLTNQFTSDLPRSPATSPSL